MKNKYDKSKLQDDMQSFEEMKYEDFDKNDSIKNELANNLNTETLDKVMSNMEELAKKILTKNDVNEIRKIFRLWSENLIKIANWDIDSLVIILEYKIWLYEKLIFEKWHITLLKDLLKLIDRSIKNDLTFIKFNLAQIYKKLYYFYKNNILTLPLDKYSYYSATIFEILQEYTDEDFDNIEKLKDKSLIMLYTIEKEALRNNDQIILTDVWYEIWIRYYEFWKTELDKKTAIEYFNKVINNLNNVENEYEKNSYYLMILTKMIELEEDSYTRYKLKLDLFNISPTREHLTYLIEELEQSQYYHYIIRFMINIYFNEDYFFIDDKEMVKIVLNRYLREFVGEEDNNLINKFKNDNINNYDIANLYKYVFRKENWDDQQILIDIISDYWLNNNWINLMLIWFIKYSLGDEDYNRLLKISEFKKLINKIYINEAISARDVDLIKKYLLI